MLSKQVGYNVLLSVCITVCYGPYAAAVVDNFMVMDDNCRPHHANLVDDFLFEEGIVRMEWPAYSPDMNPIDSVWDNLGR